jgi:ribosomal protein L35
LAKKTKKGKETQIKSEIRHNLSHRNRKDYERLREQLYINKNLEEMDKFLEIYNLQILTHEEIQNLKRNVT